MPVLSGLAVVALLILIIIAWRRQLFKARNFFISLILLLVGILGVVAAAHFGWKAFMKSPAAFSMGTNFDAGPSWLAGLMILSGVLVVLFLGLIIRRFGAAPTILAALLIYLGMGFLFHFAADAGNPLLTTWLALPFIGCIVGMGVYLFIRNPIWRTILLAGATFISLVLMVPQLWLATYTHEDVWIPVIVICAWVGLFTPEISTIIGRGIQKELAVGICSA